MNQNGINTLYRKGKESLPGFLRAGLCALLTLATLWGVFRLPAAAESPEGGTLDYDRPGASLHGVTVAPSELVATYTDCALTELEKAYADSLPNLALTCTTAIPESALSLAWAGTEVTVTAQTYGYTAANGMTVTFLPQRAQLDAQTQTMTPGNGGYTCRFSLAQRADVTVTVTYTASLAVPAAYLQEAANSAFRAGQEAKSRMADYATRLQTYNEAVAAYNAYCAEWEQYQTALTRYRAYLTEKAAYENAVAKWERYEADLETYAQALAAYNAYKAADKKYREVDLPAYAQALTVYESEMETYRAWLAENASCQSQVKACENVLQVMDSLYIFSGGKHQMYGTLKGPTVNQALVGNRALLVSACGVQRTDIDNAGDATNALIDLLESYSSLSQEKDKFIWYKAHYTEVKDNFNKLYDALRSILDSTKFQGLLQGQKKTERYAQFLAHLYLLSSCFDDTKTCDSSNWCMNFEIPKITYRFYDKVLELADYGITDTNRADPTGLTWPETGEGMEEPVRPTPPAAPEKVNMPLEPTPAAQPGAAPTSVAQPAYPATVADPGRAPMAPVFTDSLQKLYDALCDGTLQEHRSDWTDGVYTVVTDCTGLLPADEEEVRPVATFYDYAGKVVAKRVIPADVTGDFAADLRVSRERDARYVYTFTGWVDVAGEPVDWRSVQTDTAVYPAYETVARTYRVTWVLPDGEYGEDYLYGTLPACPCTTERAASAQTVYVFAGWDREVQSVTGDAVYRALYWEEPRLYDVTWKIGEEVSVTEQYSYGALPHCPFDPLADLPDTDTVIYTFEGWNAEPVPVTEDAIYEGKRTARLWVYVTDEAGRETAGASVQREEDGVTVTLPENAGIIDVTRLLDTCDGEITLTFSDGVCLYFSPAVTRTLRAGGYTTVEYARREADLFTCRVRLLTADGTVATVPGWQLRIPRTALSADSFVGFGNGTETDISLTDAYAVFVADGQTETLALKKQCTVSAVESKGGFLTLDKTLGVSGETLSFRVLPETGYRLAALTAIYRAAGEEITVPLSEDADVTLPDCDGEVTLVASFEKAIYTVRFCLEDEIYAEYRCHYGEIVHVPSDPVSYTEGETAYTFSGWTPTVVEIVTGDAVYRGSYKQSTVAKAEGGVSGQLLTPALFVLAGLMALRLLLLFGSLLNNAEKRKKDLFR